MRLLKQHDLKGLGGILLDDVQESLPHYEKVLKHRAADITFIVRPVDKKKVLFYNDRAVHLNVSLQCIIIEFDKFELQTLIFRWMRNSRNCGV